MREEDMNKSLFASTGIELLDMLLVTKIEDCMGYNIGMDVYVNTRVDREMDALQIRDSEVVRVLGSLLRNAIEAIIKTAGMERNIFVLISYNGDGNLEFLVYDSGVAFPQSVLDHLGERGNSEAGTGNGLADVMEVLNRVNASIDITPVDNPNDVYTKRVRICFDNKSERIFQ